MYSCSPEKKDFFFTWVAMEGVKQEEILYNSSDLLKIQYVKMGASWSAQTYRLDCDMLSGPAAFPDLWPVDGFHRLTQFPLAVDVLQKFYTDA